MSKMPIETLFAAFQAWQGAQLAITREYPVTMWERKMQELRDVFRSKLAKFGADEAFDWTDPNAEIQEYRAATGKDDPRQK